MKAQINDSGAKLGNSAGFKRLHDSSRPHSPATVRRRLASWSTLTHGVGCKAPLPPAARRRSELVALRLEDIAEEEPVPTDPQSPPLPCLSIRLGRTKTTAADHGAKAYLIGYPVTAFRQWLAEAGIESGAIFRRIDQSGNIDRRALNAQSVNLILKSRCPKAGLNTAQFSADGLRSGYRTEAANQGRLSRAARLVAEPDG